MKLKTNKTNIEQLQSLINDYYEGWGVSSINDYLDDLEIPISIETLKNEDSELILIYHSDVGKSIVWEWGFNPEEEAELFIEQINEVLDSINAFEKKFVKKEVA